MKKWSLLHRFSLFCNILVFVLLFSPVINYMYQILEVEPVYQKADVILLLSSGSYTDTIFTRTAYQRMFRAKQLYDQNYAPKILICGGVVDKGHPAISITMKQFLVSNGILKNDILTEEHSTNTYENMTAALPIIRENGFSTVLLVTSASHMFRSQAIAKKLGLDVLPVPVLNYETEVSSVMARSRFVLDIFREYGALAYFKLRGWI